MIAKTAVMAFSMPRLDARMGNRPAQALSANEIPPSFACPSTSGSF
jgi:hypothetical protein